MRIGVWETENLLKLNENVKTRELHKPANHLHGEEVNYPKAVHRRRGMREGGQGVDKEGQRGPRDRDKMFPVWDKDVGSPTDAQLRITAPS